MSRDAVSVLVEQVRDLFVRIGALEQRIAQLENKPAPQFFDMYRTPLEQPIKPYDPPHCVACGLRMDQPMGYVCPRADCPTGAGGIQC